MILEDRERYTSLLCFTSTDVSKIENTYIGVHRAGLSDFFYSTWCRAGECFSASGAALSQEIPTVK
jgi:hypothetical protein